jgi:D-amino-acid dehydrogenase
MTPDGLPAIGRCRASRTCSSATGHAMLGVTRAPATGEAVADLLASAAHPPALAPFDPARFGRW